MGWYDIATFAPDGRERLIEVKTTNGRERTHFHICRNELAVGMVPVPSVKLLARAESI
jgi:hypothetical protein